MKTLFIYAIASHTANVVYKPGVYDTLEKAKDAGFETIVIIKKTQLAAKRLELKTEFNVQAYPKASIAKAVKNADACIIIGDCMHKRRKKQIIDQILEKANKDNKIVMVLNIAR